MISDPSFRSKSLPGLLLALALLAGGCEPPTHIQIPDAGIQGPCPDGFIFIPAGNFEMGMNYDDALHGLSIQVFWDMTPRRTVYLSDYCIQKTEVTVADFKTCLQSGKCNDTGFQSREWNERCNHSADLTDRDNHPMNCVSWAAARAYCQQLDGGDLPSDAQWEKAARGADRRLFPWGNEMISCDRANWDVDGPYNDENHCCGGSGCNHTNNPATWPVGTAERGDSPYGLKDMSGNVSEWVLDCMDTDLNLTCADTLCVDPVNTCDAGDAAARGGSAEDVVLRAFTVLAHVSTASIETKLGFRCVVILPPNRRTARARR